MYLADCHFLFRHLFSDEIEISSSFSLMNLTFGFVSSERSALFHLNVANDRNRRGGLEHLRLPFCEKGRIKRVL
jgi:hypothetical protein